MNTRPRCKAEPSVPEAGRKFQYVQHTHCYTITAVMTTDTPDTQLSRRDRNLLLALLLVLIALAAWIADVQAEGPYWLRNALPPLLVLLLAWLGLRRGPRPRVLLAAVGFAIPAVGLSAYIHYAYSVNLNELFAGSSQPEEVFRFLPIYTSGAGVIGAAIGWIVGRNL